MSGQEELTSLLQRIDAGDALAAEQLLPIVYDELKRLAARRLADERSGHTLQPTALVHEAWMRLMGGSTPKNWNSGGHFFSAAAIAIRRILIENARRKRSSKRGGDARRVPLDDEAIASLPEPQEDLLALDEALEKLAMLDSRAAEMVQLLYFAGMTLDQAADVLQVSPRTASRLWAFARAWLRRELEPAYRETQEM